MQNGIRLAIGLGLSVPLLFAGPAAFAALDLGPAANLAVFQMGTPTGGGPGTWNTSNVDTINGNVAFLATVIGGNANVIVNGNVQGTIPPAEFDANDWTVSGGYTQVPASSLIPIADQARAFSAAAAAFTALPNIGLVTGGTYTFTAANLAEPGTYIVNATELNLSSDFILNGANLSPGSRVILNVADGFSLTGNNSILLEGGLTPAHVLINYLGASGNVVGATINGTILAPNATGLSFNNSTINGSLLVEDVNLSNTTVNGVPFIPEPSTCIACALLLLPLGASALRIVRKC